ncbi:putative glutamate receptor [Trachymyrmex septentrionalis]|uniref:Putative glutamate receptor n=1 Tax=Trachymyrmex septentrionalis TaxID=34720 RepID=A0A195EZ71_9HYME|nr:putative glutamate receptor [Trachymyrmex septentrionalis]
MKNMLRLMEKKEERLDLRRHSMVFTPTSVNQTDNDWRTRIIPGYIEHCESHIFEFYDNDTKVTGLCGHLWTLLSEKLNFTLQAIKSNEISAGALKKNQTVYTTGLLGILTRNETIAIPKTEMHDNRLIATDFTIPLWMSSQRLYIQHEVIHDNTWMAEVFSWRIWCFILIMHLLISVCSFWSQIVHLRIKNNCKRSTFGDHIFYNFGMLCNQNQIPNILVGRSRIIELSLALFCSILYMSFGALLYVYITKRINIIAPFDDLNSLLTNTEYKIVSLEGSTADIAFKIINDDTFIRIKTAKRPHRLIIAPTVERMFELACMKGKGKYTIFQGEDDYKVRNHIGCHMIPVGKSYFKIWVASGIVKNFKYKRTIDLGILRLKEVGLWNALTYRWVNKKPQCNYNLEQKAIGIDQVSLIILIMCCGMIIAFIIFIIEIIVYAYKYRSP